VRFGFFVVLGPKMRWLVLLFLPYFVSGESRIISSTYGELCVTECAFQQKSYSWCCTAKGWDYCSVFEDVDMYGDRWVHKYDILASAPLPGAVVKCRK
jgi:hypothetical protein